MSSNAAIKSVLFAGALVLAFLSIQAQAQNSNSNDIDLKMVINGISTALEDEYIFPNVAKQISTVLKENLHAGKYDKYTDLHELSDRLTQDIRSLNRDVHLNVIHTPNSPGGMRMVMRGGPGSGISEQRLKQLSRDNFGFESVEILEGNIGYLNITSFVDPTYAGKTAAAAMEYLYHTDAIIFDVRDNRGGAGEMYQLLASYLFDQGPLQLNEIYWPKEDRRYQTWTLPHLPGERMPNKDVYILTSAKTGSAAEVFSYTLKHHERATLVGEVTVGAANPVSPTRISEEFSVWMSKGEAKHPITRSNWEGKGVIPHVKTSRTEALQTAHSLALKNLAERNEEDRAYFEWFLEIAEANKAKIEVSKEVLSSYAGTYNGMSGDARFIREKNGELFYGSDEQNLTKLNALSNNRFMIPGDKTFKLEIVVEDNHVTGINRLFSTGRVITMKKGG